MVTRRQKMLFVEGGGHHNDALKTKCRKGFRIFLEKTGFAGRMPKIIACGGRQDAYDQFSIAVSKAAQGDVKQQVEKISKPDVLDGLMNATRDTKKGAYGKGAHSFKILARIDPAKVRQVAPYAERLLTHLDNML